jgi:hypothetical protein
MGAEAAARMYLTAPAQEGFPVKRRKFQLAGPFHDRAAPADSHMLNLFAAPLERTHRADVAGAWNTVSSMRSRTATWTTA